MSSNLHDQVWALRELIPDSEIYPKIRSRLRSRRIAITSGKGGVGKSVIAVNFALVLAKEGYRTLLIDGDVSLSKLPILTDSAPPFNFADVRRGKKTLQEIIYEYQPNCSILPSGSGIIDLMEAQEDFTYRLQHQFEELDGQYDCMIIDTASGISSMVFGELASSDEIFVILSPEPTAIADAYTVVKILSFFYPQIPVYLVVNLVRGREEGEEIATRFNLLTQKFLQRTFPYLGFIPRDDAVLESVRQQYPLALWDDGSPFLNQLRQIVKEWLEMSVEGAIEGREIKN